MRRENCSGSFFRFICPCFFLSGVFLKDTEAFRSLLWSKTDVLLKPYFVILIGLGLLHSLSGLPSPAYGLGLFYATGETINTEGRDHWVPLWFLPHLFVASVSGWGIIRIWKRAGLHPKGMVCVTPVFLVLGACTIQWFWERPLPGFGGPKAFFGKPVGLPFSVDFLLVSSAYVLAGSRMSSEVRNLTFRPLLFVCAVSLFCGLHYFFDETIDLHSRLYGNVVIASVQAFLGIYIVLVMGVLCAGVPIVGRPLAYIGVSSLFILLFHWAFMDLGKALSHTLVPSLPAICDSLVFLSGVLLPLALLEIVKRQEVLSALFLPTGHRREKMG